MIGIAICAAVIALISMGIGLSSAGAVGPLALVLALAMFAVSAACGIATWQIAQEKPTRRR